MFKNALLLLVCNCSKILSKLQFSRSKGMGLSYQCPLEVSVKSKKKEENMIGLDRLIDRNKKYLWVDSWHPKIINLSSDIFAYVLDVLKKDRSINSLNKGY